MRKVLGATETERVKISKVFEGTESESQDRKLLNLKQAADELGVSKTTARRLMKEGRLTAVETRLGRKRILSQSITNLILGRSNTQI